MAHIAGTDRSQAVLLPEVLDDYVGADHPVRFLDAFVARLDLDALGFQRAVPAETGRPGYAPAISCGSTSTAISTGSGPAGASSRRRTATSN